MSASRALTSLLDLTEWDSVYGCRLWIGRHDRDGYGRTADNQLAHVAVYEVEHGPIPPGHVLDHVCRRRDCVRHLEAVTRSENERRKAWGYRLRRRTCSAGHGLYQHGRRTPEGGIVCRVCSGV